MEDYSTVFVYLSLETFDASVSVRSWREEGPSQETRNVILCSAAHHFNDVMEKIKEANNMKLKRCSYLQRVSDITGYLEMGGKQDVEANLPFLTPCAMVYLTDCWFE